MKRVLTAVILIPTVVLALFKAPLWLFTLLVLGVALLAAREYFDIAEKTGFRPMRWLAYVFLICIFGVTWASMAGLGERVSYLLYGGWALIVTQAITFLLLAALLVFLAASLGRESLSQCVPDAAVSFLMIFYIGLTLLALPLIRESSFGALFLLSLMLIVWAGDIAAYYVGRAIGKHKLAPRISPGKTWEGAIASTVGATIIAIVLFEYQWEIVSGFAKLGLVHLRTELHAYPAGVDVRPRPSHPVVFALIFAFCVNVAAQLGDLFESAIKRGAGVKDSGNLLPGHGGVLDRIDALLFALPIGLFFYTVMH